MGCLIFHHGQVWHCHEDQAADDVDVVLSLPEVKSQWAMTRSASTNALPLVMDTVAFLQSHSCDLERALGRRSSSLNTSCNFPQRRIAFAHDVSFASVR